MLRSFRLFLTGIAISAALFLIGDRPPLSAQCGSTTVQVASGANGDLIVGQGPCAFGRIVAPASGQVLTSGGVGVLPSWSATPALSTITIGNGTAAAPTLTFSADTTKGFYSSATNEVSLALAGAQATKFTTTYVQSPGSFIIPTNAGSLQMGVSSDAIVSRGAAGLVRLGNASTGVEFNAATATIGTCGTGTVTTGSRGSAGEATATGATTCTVNFGANFTNVPFCTIDDETTVGGRVSSTLIGSLTVTGLVAADKFTWTCIGFF